jgi:hypothetical protein
VGNSLTNDLVSWLQVTNTRTERKMLLEISGYHSGEDVDVGLPGCNFSPEKMHVV